MQSKSNLLKIQNLWPVGDGNKNVIFLINKNRLPYFIRNVNVV